MKVTGDKREEVRHRIFRTDGGYTAGRILKASRDILLKAHKLRTLNLFSPWPVLCHPLLGTSRHVSQ